MRWRKSLGPPGIAASGTTDGSKLVEEAMEEY